jgi:phosphoribosylaminoimidazole carboxylase
MRLGSTLCLALAEFSNRSWDRPTADRPDSRSFFETKWSIGELLINEMAPRPHNSGHYTIEACPTSQYEAHIRAIVGLPLSSHATAVSTPSTNAIMLNLLGPPYLDIARKALEVKGATVHLYGKGETKGTRKMGHVTVIAGSMAEAEYQIQPLIDASDERKNKIGKAKDIAASLLPRGFIHPKVPVVAMIMGSDSDLSVMKAGAEILKKFGVEFEVTIVSAHRTPDRMVTFAKDARARGLKVIIAGAGGAAHLPGMMAAMMTLPVVGVPVKGSTLDGVDSLHSIVQMPVSALAKSPMHFVLVSDIRLRIAERCPCGYRCNQQFD